KGSQWKVLHRRLVQQLVDSEQARYFLFFSRFAYVPDEHFLQTLIAYDVLPSAKLAINTTRLSHYKLWGSSLTCSTLGKIVVEFRPHEDVNYFFYRRVQSVEDRKTFG